MEMNFILKLASSESMLKLLIFYLLANAGVCEFDGLNKFSRKKTSVGNFVHPSILKTPSSSSKTFARMENEVIESSPPLSSQVSSVTSNSLSVPLIVRRLVNVLLRKAVFKNSVGDAIQLESVSDQDLENLIMSLRFSVSASDLKTLKDFGSNKKNLTIHQIDELLNNIFSDSLPPNQDCDNYSWDLLWSSVTYKVDQLFVLELAIFLCFVWILVRIHQGKSSWSLILFAFISSAVVWEKARLLEEETIKSHSEQLRLANIPEHCHGIDNRSWWEKVFKLKSEDKECYEHHYYRLSKPTLRVSYYKAFLNLFGPFLEMIMSSIRTLFKGYEDNWLLSNWIFQAIIIPSFFLFLAFVFTVYLGGSVRFPLFSFGGVSSHSPAGSHVQSLPAKDPPKPPPRLKNGRKKKEKEEVDGGSSSSTFVFNIKGGSLNLNMAEPLPIAGKKELLHTRKKDVCEYQSSSSSKNQVGERAETDSLSEESDVETGSINSEVDMEDEKSKNSAVEDDFLEVDMEDEKSKKSASEDDCLACGDSNIAAEKVLKDQEQRKLKDFDSSTE